VYVPGAKGTRGDIELLEEQILDLSKQLHTAAAAEKDALSEKMTNILKMGFMIEVLNRLQINGQPKWGLNTAQCDLVRVALAHAPLQREPAPDGSE
jgi:hypothetical protein